MTETQTGEKKEYFAVAGEVDFFFLFWPVYLFSSHVHFTYETKTFSTVLFFKKTST